VWEGACTKGVVGESTMFQAIVYTECPPNTSPARRFLMVSAAFSLCFTSAYQEGNSIKEGISAADFEKQGSFGAGDFQT